MTNGVLYMDCIQSTPGFMHNFTKVPSKLNYTARGHTTPLQFKRTADATEKETVSGKW